MWKIYILTIISFPGTSTAIVVICFVKERIKYRPEFDTKPEGQYF